LLQGPPGPPGISIQGEKGDAGPAGEPGYHSYRPPGPVFGDPSLSGRPGNHRLKKSKDKKCYTSCQITLWKMQLIFLSKMLVCQILVLKLEKLVGGTVNLDL
jgi:hypothetical protein